MDPGYTFNRAYMAHRYLVISNIAEAFLNQERIRVTVNMPYGGEGTFYGFTTNRVYDRRYGIIAFDSGNLYVGDVGENVPHFEGTLICEIDGRWTITKGKFWEGCILLGNTYQNGIKVGYFMANKYYRD